MSGRARRRARWPARPRRRPAAPTARCGATRRWASAGLAISFTSSGVTKSRPWSTAWARASFTSASEPRGLAPTWSWGSSRVAVDDRHGVAPDRLGHVHPLQRALHGRAASAAVDHRRRSVDLVGAPPHAPVDQLPLVVGRRVADRRARAGTGRAGPRAAGRCPRTRSGSGWRPRGRVAGSRWVVPSAVTWRSCMASSSAAWVLAGARFISSAEDQVGEDRARPEVELARPRSSTDAPVMSAGSRSGVNWTRGKASPVTVASERAMRVLATPGRSSRSTWPSARRPTRTSSSTWRLPTTARSISSRIALARAAVSSRLSSPAALVPSSQLLQLRDELAAARAPRWCPARAGPAPPSSPARAALGPRVRPARPRRRSRRGGGAVAGGPRRARCGRASRWRACERSGWR